MTEEEWAEQFDEMLDDCYEPFRMGGFTFYASDILKSCDPIAYDIELCDYIDSQMEEEEND